MKSRALIASVLVLLVYVAFAEEASKNEIKDVAQPATKDNVVAATTTEDPKQINQGGGGGGGGGFPGGQCGYGRQRYCCGGWSRGYCQSWCCRGASAEEASKHESKDVTQPAMKETHVAATTEEPKQINQGGGGGGGCGYGRQRYCCGEWRSGYCQSWCCRGGNEVGEVEQAKNVEVGKENDVVVATEEPKQINQGGGGGGGQCGYGRQRYCCGGWRSGYCQSWCCRGANEVEPAANHAGNTDVQNAEDHKAASKENQAAAHKAETKN